MSLLTFLPTLASPISSPDGTYHYSICPVSDSSLATISSDNHLRIIDPGNLSVITSSTDSPRTRNGIHPDPQTGDSDGENSGVTCLKGMGDVLLTAGRDGVVRMWDPRVGFGNGEVRKWRKEGTPILSLDGCQERGLVAAGMELGGSGGGGEVVVWDFAGGEKMSYVESHNDDVTTLQFHPSTPEFLLSGSTDGLINIYDMRITEEDDALHQVINHGSSIHHAGFISGQAVYGLSHDEVLSVYKVADAREEVEEPAPVVFGDIRKELGCEYAIDMLLRGGKDDGTGIMAVGRHGESPNDQWVDLQSLSIGPDGKWALGREQVVRLAGAHGEEVVRCLYVHDGSSTIFTGGEDGLVKAWRAAG